MSAIGQLLDTVESKVRELLGDFVLKNKEQDGRLDDLDRRVKALESGTGQTAAKKATAARPSTAGAKSSATGTK